MLGGYQILDLRNIGLTLGNSQVSITDAEILNQLRNLRNYIEKGHDYKKALDNSPKPVLIRYRDAKNNEKLEVSAFASVTSSNNSLTYNIRAKGLQIEVVFEEKTDDDDNKYYDIKNAKYKYSEIELVEGDMSIGGDLDIDGDAEVGGDLSVTGDITGDKFIGDVAMESIKDADGHKRFIEDDITLDTNISTEISKVYGKWSLSGSHLILVLCIDIDVVNLTSQTKLCDIQLPSWILDKIIPLFSNVVDRQTFVAFSDDYSSQNNVVYLTKVSISISFMMNAINVTALKHCRIEFDLLIDNE